MFGVVPEGPLWERPFPADEKNRIALATNCLCVGRGFTAVIESGLGERWDEKSRALYAIDHATTLPRSLERLGVRPEDVDALILSHLHFDHAGAPRASKAGGPSRPSPTRRSTSRQTELAHARAPNERDRASYRPEDWEPWAAVADASRRFPAKEIRPGITAVPIRGHNAGCRRSAWTRAAAPSSTSPTPSRRARTSPSPGSWPTTSTPSTSIENKKRLLAQAVRDQWLCVFEHDPRVPWGTIVEDPDGRRRVEPFPRRLAACRSSPLAPAVERSRSASSFDCGTRNIQRREELPAARQVSRSNRGRRAATLKRERRDGPGDRSRPHPSRADRRWARRAQVRSAARSRR